MMLIDWILRAGETANESVRKGLRVEEAFCRQQSETVDLNCKQMAEKFARTYSYSYPFLFTATR